MTAVRGDEMTIRQGGRRDALRMYELDQICFAAPFRFSFAVMLRSVAEPGAVLLLAETAGILAGFVVLHMLAETDTAYVVTLDVAPESRRLGIARSLMEGGEAQMRRAGAASVQLHVFAENGAAIALYERLGYQRLERIRDFYGRELDAWVYEKALR